MAVCHIAGAGEFVPRGLAPAGEDFVIAADGGLKWLAGMGIRPHLLVGDFDSLGTPPPGLPTLRHPVEKDDTDTGLALREGLARGYRQFRLYGGGGGRLDHFLANLQLLAWLSRQGARGALVCRDFDALAVTDGALDFPAAPAGTLLSVFCLGEPARGVTLSGLKYPLKDAELSPFFPLGVSNAYTGAPARVEVEKGTLLVLDFAAP